MMEHNLHIKAGVGDYVRWWDRTPSHWHLYTDDPIKSYVHFNGSGSPLLVVEKISHPSLYFLLKVFDIGLCRVGYNLENAFSTHDWALTEEHYSGKVKF